MGGLTAITAILAIVSYIYSARAFKQTEKTLNKTEAEQEIRDIETSLDLFYYPLRDYLDDVSIAEKNPYLKTENGKNTAKRGLELYNGTLKTLGENNTENEKSNEEIALENVNEILKNEDRKNNAERAQERYNEISKHIAPHRYLATPDTRMKFEVLRREGYHPRNEAETQELSDSVDKYIIEKEGERNELKEKLEKLKHSERKPFWKFWG